MAGWLTLHVAALVLTAAAFGGMAFLAAVFAPKVFRTLPREEAGRLMRAIFPAYYKTGATVLALAALALLPGGSYGVEIALLSGTAFAFVALHVLLLPRIEERRKTGDRAGFARLHKISAGVNLAQFVAVAVALLRLAE